MIDRIDDLLMNPIKLLESVLFRSDQQLEGRKDSYRKRAKRGICTACNGAGKVVIGFGAICTEPVEKVGKCPRCFGAGYRSQSQTDNAMLQEQLDGL
jgi:hypothetical protein